MPGRELVTRGRGPLFHGLRARLFVIVLLVTVPAFVIFLVHGIDERRSAREMAVARALGLARAIALEYESHFDDAVRLLRVLAASERVRPEDPAALSAWFAELLPHADALGNVGLIGPDGVVVASGLPFEPGVDLSDRSYVRRAIETRRLAVGSFQVGRLTRRPGINLGQPVLSAEGEVVGVLFAALDLQHMGAVPARLERPPGTTVEVVDRDGIVLLTEPDRPELVGRPHPRPEIASVVLTTRDGTAAFPDAEGTLRNVGFTILKGGDADAAGFVVVGFDDGVVVGPVYEVLVRGLLWLAVAAAVALGAAGLVAHLTILGPMAGLVSATARVRGGDLTARAGPRYQRSEIGTLQRSFDEMAAVIERDRNSLSAAADEYRELVEEIPAVLYVVALSPKPLTIFTSPQVEALSGYAADEWLGGVERRLERVHPEDRERVVAAFQRAAAGKDGFSEEYRIVARDGRVRWLRDVASLHGDPGARPNVLRGFMVDITDRKLLAEQLQRSQKLEAVGQLAAGVVHDFNNLITVILGTTQLLHRMAETNPEARERLEDIRGAADRAATLSRQLLALSRKQEFEPVVLDLNASVQGLERMLRRLVGSEIDLVTRLEVKLGRTRADPGQLDQVLLNLCVNARDAMPSGGRMVLETSNVDVDGRFAATHPGVRPGSYVRVSVSDTGHGMDDATKRRIFEPFFTTKPPGKGTGLGLATTYGIVRQSGGFATFYSEVGKGTTFHVHLPRVDDELPAPPPALALVGSARATGTILVVDDEEAIRFLVAETLRDMGYTVIEAADGMEALTAIGADGRDLVAVVTDVGLPGIDGRDLASRIVAAHPDVRVLLMSGYAEGAVLDARSPPGAAYLGKPFTVTELARCVRGVVGGTAV